jgi:hypothetical protein
VFQRHTRFGHHAEGSTMRNLATMAAPTTNTKRLTVHCSKHAFAPIASFRPKIAVTPSVALPAQRHQTCLGRAGLASESPFTGDDPVNGVDPTGLYPGQGWLDKERHKIASDADTQWNGIKSFATGLVGTSSGCNTNMAAYDAGNLTWWGDAIGSLFDNGGYGGSDDDTEQPQVTANQAAGNAARDAIAAQFPGAETEVTFTTDLGVRRVDVLTPNGEAIEVKVGSTSLTTSVQSQIAKDQWLVANSPVVAGVQWVFEPSAITGQVGPSGPLAAALEKAGIPWSVGG